MNKEFYQGNRKLYAQMKENALLVLFSGTEVRKTNDEFYPFYTNRNFLYLTGLDQKDSRRSPERTRGPGDGEGLYPAAGLAGRALERRAHQGGGSRGALRHRGRRLHGQL